MEEEDAKFQKMGVGGEAEKRKKKESGASGENKL